MPDKDLNKSFGLLIAYVVPGFLALWALSSFDVVSKSWLGSSRSQEATVGGFLFAALASIGVGVVLNAVRWHILEGWLFKRVRSKVPREQPLDWQRRQEHESTASTLHESQYRFFQFYGNTLVALACAFAPVLARALDRWPAGATVALVAVFVVVEVVLYRSAKSCLVKYRERMLILVGKHQQQGAA